MKVFLSFPAVGGVALILHLDYAGFLRVHNMCQ